MGGLRGTPVSVGTMEEIIDYDHAKMLTSMGSEHCVSLLACMDKGLLAPGCSVLLIHKVHAMIEVLMDDTDPLVTVTEVEKAPQETHADTGDQGWTAKSRKSRNPWSFLSPTQSLMK